MGQPARAFFLGVLIVVYLACHSPHAVACMVVCEANANASSSSFFISNSRLRTKRLVNALTPRCCGRPTVVAHKHACGPRAGHPVVNPVHCNTPFNTMESMSTFGLQYLHWAGYHDAIGTYISNTTVFEKGEAFTVCS